MLSCAARRTASSRQRHLSVTRATANETSEDALQRRLRESQRVDERVKFIYNSEDWHRELAGAGTGLVVLEVRSRDCLPTPCHLYRMPSACYVVTGDQWSNAAHWRCMRRTRGHEPPQSPSRQMSRTRAASDSAHDCGTSLIASSHAAWCDTHLLRRTCEPFGSGSVDGPVAARTGGVQHGVRHGPCGGGGAAMARRAEGRVGALHGNQARVRAHSAGLPGSHLPCPRGDLSEPDGC